MRDDSWELFDELAQLCSDGVRLYLGECESTPAEILDACELRESYMRDYVTDQKGVISEIRFQRIDEFQ